jgi:cell division protein FtsW
MISDRIKGDVVIWVIAIIFSLASLLIVYSSTISLAYQHETVTEYYLFKQFIIALFGILLLYIVHLVNFQYYSRIGQFLFYLSVPLLVATFFFASGLDTTYRYIHINLPVAGRMSFQPSDLAKLALVMYIARYLAKNQENIKILKPGLLKIFVPIVIVCVLILRSNLSTAFIIFACSMLLLYIGRAKIAHISLLTFVGIAGLAIMLVVARHHPELLPRAKIWGDRIEGFFAKGEDKEPNIQVKHSQIAVAQGGLLGKGPGNSTQRNFLPLAYNDYVFAIIMEEYGLLGGVITLLLFLILLFRSMKIARRCRYKFGSYLVIGISLMMVIQALLNMAVAVGLFPVTGQPLPFLSMGGTSFWFSCIGLGIILSVSRSVGNTNPNVTERLAHATN